MALSGETSPSGTHHADHRRAAGFRLRSALARRLQAEAGSCDKVCGSRHVLEQRRSAPAKHAQSSASFTQTVVCVCSDSQRARRTAHRSDSCSHVSRRCAADPAPRDLSFRRSAQNSPGHRRGAFQRCAHALQRYDALSKFSESRFLAHPPPHPIRYTIVNCIKGVRALAQH